MNAERLQELRAEHQPAGAGRVMPANTCDRCFEVWPCEESAILDLALEAEWLRGECDNWMRAAAAGTNLIAEQELEAERLRELCWACYHPLHEPDHCFGGCSWICIHGTQSVLDHASTLAGTEAKT